LAEYYTGCAAAQAQGAEGGLPRRLEIPPIKSCAGIERPDWKNPAADAGRRIGAKPRSIFAIGLFFP